MAKLQILSDKLAIGFSMVCVIHCLVLPILPIMLILLPPLSGLFALDDEMFHQWVLYAVVPISIAALIILSTTLGHDLLGETGEVVISILGSMIIAYGHFRNYQLSSARHETQ
jgi:hypothetical protein